MGFAMAYGLCACCRQTFGFNPIRVPSCRINGNREPICGICVPQINIRRRANGLAEIIPSADAYQACEEFGAADPIAASKKVMYAMSNIRQTLNSLCTAIRVFVQKGDNQGEKAEQFYAEAGARLRVLKDRLKAERHNTPWESYVKDQCKLSRSRADELIRIADKRETVFGSRQKKATSVAKSKAKQTAASSGGSASKTSSGQTDKKSGNGHGCDYNSTGRNEEPGEPYHITRARGYFASIDEAIRLARENLFVVENRAEWARLDPSEITNKVINAAERVIEAWTECLNQLHQLRGRSIGNETENRSSLH
jgi:hypothetical protein